jgi:hypothetical protein
MRKPHNVTRSRHNLAAIVGPAAGGPCGSYPPVELPFIVRNWRNFRMCGVQRFRANFRGQAIGQKNVFSTWGL